MVFGLPEDVFFFYAGNLYSLPRTEGETVGDFQERALKLFGEEEGQDEFQVLTCFGGIPLDLSDSLEWVAIRENDRVLDNQRMGLRERPFYIVKPCDPARHPETPYRSIDDWVRRMFKNLFSSR